jgi:NADH-ubiquinone oxidoreductase chain 5
VTGAIYVDPFRGSVVEYEYISVFQKNLPFLGSIISVLWCVFCSTIFRFKLSEIKASSLGYYLYFFFNRKWGFDLLANRYFVVTALSFGYNVSFKLVDGFLQYYGPFGSSILV